VKVLLGGISFIQGKDAQGLLGIDIKAPLGIKETGQLHQSIVLRYSFGHPADLIHGLLILQQMDYPVPVR
jgi:hypothetical protein